MTPKKTNSKDLDDPNIPTSHLPFLKPKTAECTGSLMMVTTEPWVGPHVARNEVPIKTSC